MPIENNSADDLQLIVPNLHRRYSGVTATNRMVAPKLARTYRAAWLGPHAPDGIARMGFADLLKLWRRRNSLIWHARRNDEMIAGVLLRGLGWPYYFGLSLAGGMMLYHWTLIRDRSREGCFKAFRHNNWVGGAIFAGIVLSYASGAALQ